MAQPTEYDPDTQFLAFELAQPQFPGQELDVEFTAIRQTLDEVLANLELIQRDDGELANGSVGYDQLDAALTAGGIYPLTVWATSTAYTQYQCVVHGLQIFRCEVSHTSGVFATDLAADYWSELADLAVDTPDLTAIEELTGTGILRRTGDDAWSVGTTVSIGEGGTGATSAGDARTALGLVIGTNVQAFDADLSALAALTSAANKLPYFTGSAAAALADFTAYGRSIVAVADEAAFKAAVNLEAGTDFNAYHARLADIAGATYAQGNIIYYNGSNLVVLAPGSAGEVLVTGGAGANPAWASAAGTGDVTAASSFGTDNLLIRSDGTGKGVQVSAISVADTTGDLSHASGSGIGVQGTNTNDDAAAGQYGEHSEASIDAGSAVTLTTNVAANITSISLGAGDWDVHFMAQFACGVSSCTNILAGLNTTTGTLPSDTTAGLRSVLAVAITDNTTPSLPGAVRRFSFGSTTTVYLVGRAGFSGAAVTAYGLIRARRVR